MKNLKAYYLIIVLLAVSGISHAQVFTADEFVNLAYKNPDQVKNEIERKGYNLATTESSDLSKNEIYTGQNRMNVSVISPSFSSGQTLISWEFVGRDNIYQEISRDLSREGYKLLEREVRNSSRYISSTYQRPGITITLSKDRLKSNEGIYRLSIRYNAI